MIDEKNQTGRSEAKTQESRLPGFINDRDIGLGDLLKRATSYLGVKPCGGCEKRAATLNAWFPFSSRRQ